MIYLHARLSFAVVSALLLLLSGCGGGNGSTQPAVAVPTASVQWQATENPQWPVSTASAEGLNATLLNQAYQAGATTSGLYAMLVIRRGRLVAEAYYQNRRAADLYQLRSVTKTLLSNLVGLAIRDGHIQSLQQPINELLPQRYRALLNGKAPVTVADLLTMRSGFSWDENTTSGYNNWVLSADPARYLLERPQSQPPGSTFSYNSANFHLLSVILTEVTGMATRDYAVSRLFNPLGISQFRWEKLGDGYDNGGAGLELSARDLAKLALLWQQQGLYNGQQLLPAAYQQMAAELQQASERNYGGLQIRGYGLGWWLYQQSASPAGQLGWGHGGQFVVTVPAQELTLVLLSNHQTTNAIVQEQAVLQLVSQYLLPAVQ